MEPTKTEVFECTKCGALSKDADQIKKCLAQHRKEEAKAEKETAFFNIQNKLNFILINNLKSFRSEDVKSILIDAAKMVGYNLNLTISNSSVAADHYGKLCANYSVSGSFKKVGTSEFSGVKVPSSCISYLRQLLDAKHSTYVGDLFRLIKGIDIYSGGGGSENFSYSLKLLMDQFPDLKEAYSEYNVLNVASNAHSKRSLDLSTEYKKNILPTILHSDIPYQELKIEYDELFQKVEELQVQVSKINSKMSARQDVLSNQHSKKFITPESNYDYNAERLTELRRKLF